MVIKAIADGCLVALSAYVVLQLLWGALNKMTRGVPNPVRCAVALLILPGAAGMALWPFLHDFGDYVYVLLMGGLALLFTVDRRISAPEPLQLRRLYLRVGFIAVTVIGGLVANAAEAQPVRPPVPFSTEMECRSLGMWVTAMGDIRDAGAELDKHIAILQRRNVSQPAPVQQLLVREARRVYAETKTSADDLGYDVYERCVLGMLWRRG